MLNKRIIYRITFCLLIILLFKPTWLLNNENLGVVGDDMSYWLHASTLAFDLDFDYTNDHNFDSFIYHEETNTPYHSPGSGYASAIFVKIFSLFDPVSELSEIRSNPVGSYALLGYLFGSLVFCYFGFYYFNKLLNEKNITINKKIIFLIILSGTLAQFVTNRFLMAHSFEFFLVVFILYVFETKDSIAHKFNFANLALAYFLLSITRPSTFIFTLCLVGVYYKKFRNVKGNIFYNLITFSTLVCFYIFLAQKLYNQNSFLLNLSQNSTTAGISEDINFEWIINGFLESLNLIFSPSMGILWSTPVIIFGIICLILNKKYINNLNLFQKLSLFAYFFGCLLVLYVWQGREASFGQRLLIGIIPYCAYQLGLYFNNKNTKILIPFISISYLGSLFLYSSSNLTLQYGTTLWNTVIDWAAEDYYFFLVSEIFKFENVASMFSRTVFFIDGIFLTNIFESSSIIDSLEPGRKSRFLNFVEIYNNLEVTYFILLNFILFYFSFYLEKLTRK